MNFKRKKNSYRVIKTAMRKKKKKNNWKIFNISSIMKVLSKKIINIKKQVHKIE